MATEPKRIQRIIDSVSNVNNGQIAIETGADPDIGGIRFGYKDAAGGVHKCLNKDEAARVTTLNATSSLQRNGNEVFVNGDAYIDLDTSSSAPSETPGRIFWDIANDCPAYYDSVAGTIVQITKEMLVDAVNDTGAQIDNGTVVCVTGADATANLPEVGKANSDTYDLNEVLAVATHNVSDTATGKFTKFGLVNDFDTSSLTAGGRVYLSTTSGEMTSTRPNFPATPIIVGYCIKSHATEGRVLVDIHTDRYDYEFDGCAVEKQEYYIVEQSGNVYCDVEKFGSGDLPCQLSGDVHLLDCTTGSGVLGRARVALTAGTDIAPQYNYVYVNLVGGVATLQSSTTAPSGVYANIAYISLWSAARTATDGPAMNRRTTDAIAHDGRGHISHINERIRSMGAAWVRGSGITPTVTINTTPTPDSVDASFTAGEFWQLHKQSSPALQISVDGGYLINASGSGSFSRYEKITDLNVLDELADGTALLNGNRINIVIVMLGNKSTSECKLGVIMPTGVYSNDDAAYKDINQYTPLVADDAIWEVCFPIVRIPLSYAATGNFSFINPVGSPEVVDLRGVPMNASSSGSGGSSGATSHPELLDKNGEDEFQHYNSTPASGEAAFDISDAITTNSHAKIEQRSLTEIYTGDVVAGHLVDAFSRVRATEKYVFALTTYSSGSILKWDRRTGHYLAITSAGNSGAGCLIDDGTYLAHLRTGTVDIYDMESFTQIASNSVSGLALGYSADFDANGDCYVIGPSGSDSILQKVEDIFQSSASVTNIRVITEVTSAWGGDRLRAMCVSFDDNYVFVITSAVGDTVAKLLKSDGTVDSTQTLTMAATGAAPTLSCAYDGLRVVNNEIVALLSQSDLSIIDSWSVPALEEPNGSFYDNIFYNVPYDTTPQAQLSAYQFPSLAIQSPIHFDGYNLSSSTIAQLRDSESNRIVNTFADFQRNGLDVKQLSKSQFGSVVESVETSEPGSPALGKYYLMSGASTWYPDTVAFYDERGWTIYPLDENTGRIYCKADYIYYQYENGELHKRIDTLFTGTTTATGASTSSGPTDLSGNSPLLESGDLVNARFEIMATQRGTGLYKIIEAVIPVGYAYRGDITHSAVIDAIAGSADVASIDISVENTIVSSNSLDFAVIHGNSAGASGEINVDWVVRMTGDVNTGVDDSIYCTP